MVFCSNTPFIGTFFTYVDQQGIVHEPDLYNNNWRNFTFIFSGIWFVKIYLAKRKKDIKNSCPKTRTCFWLKAFDT